MYFLLYILYLGDLVIQRRDYTNKNFIGLSLNKSDNFHIKHDILNKLLINDNSVDIVQSEDVMEHIEYNMLKTCINDIYRVLKPNGLFRLSLPDYKCDVLYNRSVKDCNGNIIFDEGGGVVMMKKIKKLLVVDMFGFQISTLLNHY